MPSIGNKNRTKAVTQTEINAIESLTQGETLPTEYIPSIDAGNYIDPTASVNLQGEPRKTGLHGFFSQLGLDKLLKIARITPKHVQNNTTAAINADKISSSLLLAQEANTPLANIDYKGKYLGDNIYQKEDLDKILDKYRVKVWRLASNGKYHNGGDAKNAFTNQPYTWSTWQIPITRADEIVEITTSSYIYLNDNRAWYFECFRSTTANFSANVTSLGVRTFEGGLGNRGMLNHYFDFYNKTLGINNAPVIYYYKLVITRPADVAFGNIYNGDLSSENGNNYIYVKTYDKSNFNQN